MTQSDRMDKLRSVAVQYRLRDSLMQKYSFRLYLVVLRCLEHTTVEITLCGADREIVSKRTVISKLLSFGPVILSVTETIIGSIPLFTHCQSLPFWSTLPKKMPS